MRIGKATGTLQLTSNAEGIARAASRDYLRALNQRIRSRIPQLRESLKQKVEDWLLNSEDFALLDQYRGELGVVDLQGAKQRIAKHVANTLVVRFLSFKRSGSNVVGGVKVLCAPVDNEYLLGEDFAFAGGYFPWLEAVLTKGDEIVVRNYFYSSRILSPEKLAALSRTGEGIMLPSHSRNWRVPPPIAGTESNNIITRALNSAEVHGFLKREFQRLLT